MDSLFSIAPNLPPGFIYEEDFISESEEQELLNYIQKFSLHEFKFHGFTAKRKVESFGYDYNFSDSSLHKGKPIPAEFNFLIAKVADYTGMSAADFRQILLIEYPVNSTMNWHRDAPPFDRIAGVSLLSDCRFRIRPYDKSKQNRSAIVSLEMKRRSFYLMKDEVRSEWEHSVAPVKNVRYSITLRTLR